MLNRVLFCVVAAGAVAGGVSLLAHTASANNCTFPWPRNTTLCDNPPGGSRVFASSVPLAGNQVRTTSDYVSTFPGRALVMPVRGATDLTDCAASDTDPLQGNGHFAVRTCVAAPPPTTIRVISS